MAAICILIVGDAAHPPPPDLIPVRLIGEVGLWVAAIVTIITGSEISNWPSAHGSKEYIMTANIYPLNVIGITGWSGSGKTSLIIRLIPELRARGMRVATLKHAHHSFDLDTAERTLQASGRWRIRGSGFIEETLGDNARKQHR